MTELGITFHRTFALSRPEIAHIVRLAHINCGAVPKRDILLNETSLGTIQVEAMPRYARGCGLLDSRGHLSVFGQQVAHRDPSLSHPGTQWLMHYHLSAVHGAGPAFWHELVRTRFRTGERFSAADLTSQLNEFVLQTAGKQLVSRSLRSTITIFLGTYGKDDGLGGLRILSDEGGESYRVLLPPPPPVWAVAYAVLDHWKARYGERLTVNLEELVGDNGLAPLFLMGASEFEQVLAAMEREGYVEVYRVARPYQVVLARTAGEPILRSLYKT